MPFYPSAYFVAQRVDVRYLVQGRSNVRAQVVHHQRGPLRLRIVFFHQPAHPFRLCRRRMVGRHIGPAPIIKRGVVRLGTPHTETGTEPLVEEVVGHFRMVSRVVKALACAGFVFDGLDQGFAEAVGALKPVECIRCAENVVVLQNFLTRMALMGRGLPVMAATRSQSRLRPTIHGCASPSPGDIERSLGGAIHTHRFGLRHILNVHVVTAHPIGVGNWQDSDFGRDSQGLRSRHVVFSS